MYTYCTLLGIVNNDRHLNNIIIILYCFPACLYTKSEWNSCDTDSNTQTRMHNLKRGDGNICVQNKTVTRTCLQFISGNITYNYCHVLFLAFFLVL